MYKGIVLDEMQEKAFLSIAASEGLICEKGMSDGMYKKATQYNPSYKLVEDIFRQFVVAGAIYIDPLMYKYLDGELIEKKIIMPYKKDKRKLEFCYFDVSSIQKMLKERNYDIHYYTEERIIDIWRELKEKAIICLSMEEKYGFDYTELNIRDIFVENGQIESYDNFREAKIYQELYSEIKRNVIYNTIAEYRKILNIAYSNDLLCPVVNNTKENTPNSIIGSDSAIRILKYTSERLGKIYVANTIKDNLSMILSDEAVAYRNKVNEWIMALSMQDVDSIEIIENEIMKVQRAMKHKKGGELIGKISATVGVISSILAHNPPLKAMCIIAEVATYIGAPTAFYDPFKRKYLWASFGMNINK